MFLSAFVVLAGLPDPSGDPSRGAHTHKDLLRRQGRFVEKKFITAPPSFYNCAITRATHRDDMY